MPLVKAFEAQVHFDRVDALVINKPDVSRSEDHTAVPNRNTTQET